MHKLTNLVYRKTNIRTSKGAILKSSNHTTVESRILKRLAFINEQCAQVIGVGKGLECTIEALAKRFDMYFT